MFKFHLESAVGFARIISDLKPMKECSHFDQYIDQYKPIFSLAEAIKKQFISGEFARNAAFKKNLLSIFFFLVILSESLLEGSWVLRN